MEYGLFDGRQANEPAMQINYAASTREDPASLHRSLVSVLIWPNHGGGEGGGGCHGVGMSGGWPLQQGQFLRDATDGVHEEPKERRQHGSLEKEISAETTPPAG